MKKIALLLMCAMVLPLAAGCAKKTASEQLEADMKKAGKQINKDTKALFE